MGPHECAKVFNLREYATEQEVRTAWLQRRKPRFVVFVAELAQLGSRRGPLEASARLKLNLRLEGGRR